MTKSAQIIAALADAGEPLSLNQIQDATGFDDSKSVTSLLGYLVRKGDLVSVASDSGPKWSARSKAVRKAELAASAVVMKRRGRPRKSASKPATAATVASVMAASMEQETLPHVCLNLGNGDLVVTCGEQVVKLTGRPAAQHLHAQLTQAITALEALDGR